MIKKKQLLHSPTDDSYINIQPAKNFIPSWYKDSNRFKDGMNLPNRFPVIGTYKICLSFTDAFTTGYMIPLVSDLLVEQTEGGPVFSWNSSPEQFVICRDAEVNKNLPIPDGYSKNHYAWYTKHMFEIPKGYSAIITHPLNRFDLPFITLSGIVDGHMVLHNGHIPFYFNNTFEGLLPAGTPIAQVILFKTEDWESKRDVSILNQGYMNLKESNNLAFGWYKKYKWKKKKYD